jgi:hypothetical protein
MLMSGGELFHYTTNSTKEDNSTDKAGKIQTPKVTTPSCTRNIQHRGTTYELEWAEIITSSAI